MRALVLLSEQHHVVGNRMEGSEDADAVVADVRHVFLLVYFAKIRYLARFLFGKRVEDWDAKAEVQGYLAAK